MNNKTISPQRHYDTTNDEQRAMEVVGYNFPGMRDMLAGTFMCRGE